jgi:hypothetical protein
LLLRAFFIRDNAAKERTPEGMNEHA